MYNSFELYVKYVLIWMWHKSGIDDSTTNEMLDDVQVVGSVRVDQEASCKSNFSNHNEKQDGNVDKDEECGAARKTL